MNIHSLIDEQSLKVVAGLKKNLRYFSEDTDSKRLVDLPAETHISIPTITKEGYLQAEGTCDGVSLDPGFLIYRWVGPEAPLVIYHHGAAEGKFDFGFKRIFRKTIFRTSNINLIAVKGPFCGSNIEFFRHIPSLKRYTALVSGSVVTVEEIISFFRGISDRAVTLSGTSLGGMVACLHALAFGSADMYLPLYAGPEAGEIFINSAYSVMTDDTAKKEHADTLRHVLNFGREFRETGRLNVFPALGKYDRIFDFDLHSAFFQPKTVTVFDKGHSTGGSASGQLADYIYTRMAGGHRGE